MNGSFLVLVPLPGTKDLYISQVDNFLAKILNFEQRWVNFCIFSEKRKVFPEDFSNKCSISFVELQMSDGKDACSFWYFELGQTGGQ